MHCFLQHITVKWKTTVRIWPFFKAFFFAVNVNNMFYTVSMIETVLNI